MNMRHVSDEELDRWLAEGELPDELSEHCQSCIACRRRREALLAVAEQARGADPDERARGRIREVVLTRWSGRQPVVWRRWALAVAAMILLALVPVLRRSGTASAPLNPDTVLAEVDRVLDRDPLANLAPEELVAEIVPENGGSRERSL